METDHINEFAEFRSQVILHQQMKDVLKQIDRLHQSGAHKSGAECMLLVGPSGSGKTCILQTYRDRHPPVRETERDRLPILFVETPPRATLKGLAEIMLAALGDPAPEKGTHQSMTRRVHDLLKRREVELVILDEFQHLVDREGTATRIAYEAADWIKSLLNVGICPFLLAGTELAEVVIEANEQLQRRCMANLALEPMGYTTAHEQNYFRKILAAFDQILPLSDRSNLHDADLAMRMHAATGGVIGRITQVLSEACRIAMDENLRCLNREVLGDAWATSASPSTDLPNPFRTKTPPKPELGQPRSRQTRLKARGQRRHDDIALRA